MNPFTQLAAAFSHAHINSGIETTPNADEISSPGFSKRKKKRIDDDIASTGKRSNWIDDINLIDATVAATEETNQSDKLKRKRTRKRKNKTALASPPPLPSPPKPQPRKPISFVKAQEDQICSVKKRTSHVR